MMDMKQRCSMIAANAITATALAFSAHSAGAEEIQLGALVSLDGPASFVGIGHQEGMRVAVGLINKDPQRYLGSKSRAIAVDFRSAGSTNAQALSLSRDFVRDPKYLAILGPSLSPQALALGPFAQQAQIPLLIPTSPAADRTVAGNYVFAIAQDGEALAEAGAAAFLKKYPNTKRAGVVYGSDNQGNILIANSATKAFKAGGVEVTQFSLPFSSLDFASAIDTMKRANVEVIYLGQGSPAVTAAVQQAERVGFKPRYVGYGTMAAPTVLKNVGKALDGSIIATDYDPELLTKLNAEFKEAFKKANDGSDPDTYSAHGFTAVMLVANAVKAMSGEITRVKLRDALAATKKMESVLNLGSLSFTDIRTVPPPPALIMVVGNELKTYKP